MADLDEHRQGWTAAQLIDKLKRTRPATEELVVDHGDLFLPNLPLDPETLRINGPIDVARLGIADRYADLALMTRSLTDDSLNPNMAAAMRITSLPRTESRT